MNECFDGEQVLFSPAPPEEDAIPLILAFPNTYTVGITSLGYQVVWATLCSRSDLVVSRLFTDGQEALPSQPEWVGFSISWELDYSHVLNLLEQLRIPLRSRDRDDTHPLVFAGGPVVTANPEPYADFFDVILLGDGEELLHDMITTYQRIRRAPRAQQWRQLAQVPGLYVPALYEPIYGSPTDPVTAILPLEAGIPAVVEKRTYRGNTLSVSTVVTAKAAWESIFMVEVARSCPEMCRFCLASYLTLPFRGADLPGHLIPAVERGLRYTDRIGLLGASVTQHPQFDELLETLAEDRFDHVRLSVASVRTGTVTPRLAQVLSQRGSRSITVAIESGSERIRQVINKKLTNPEILAAAAAAQSGGLKGIKFYGMVGIPTETEADLDETVALLKHLKQASPHLRLTLGCSTFVPKAQTPFQWQGVDPQAEKKLLYLGKRIRPLGVEFRPEPYRDSVVQALLSRGDRRLSGVLERVRQWGDSLGSYKRAFKELRGQVPPWEFYVHENWSPEIGLPWSHLRTAIPPERLKRDRATALAEATEIH